jgi:hypothetical protein
MTIEFTLQVPDEPYKPKITKGKTVNCRYMGPRYLVVRYDTDTGLIKNIDGRTDDLSEYDIQSFCEDGCGFTLLDAVAQPFIASCITGYYENDAIDEYTETLPTGELYKFEYETPRGIIGQIYKQNTVVYNATTNTYSQPKFLEPAFTNEEFFETKLTRIGDIEHVLNSQEFSNEDRTTLVSYVNWLKNIKNNYPGIDYWKLPYPKDLPSF